MATDIIVDAPLAWPNSTTLIFTANRYLIVNRAIEVRSGSIEINAGNDYFFGEAGHIEFKRGGSSGITINKKQYLMVNSIRELKRALGHSSGSGQFFALRKSIVTKNIQYGLPILPGESFQGTLEGLGNSISNLETIDRMGFFYSIDGEVRDLRLKNVQMSGFEGGGLASENGGTIENCTVSGTINGTQIGGVTGGLIGFNTGLIVNSSSSATITGSQSGDVLGGLVGINETEFGSGARIEQSYATGAVMDPKTATVGGLVGQNLGGMVSNSYATGSVSGGSTAEVGGLFGENAYYNRIQPAVSNIFATGQAIGDSGAIIGGLYGSDLAQINTSQSYWDLDTSGISDPSQGAGNIANDPGITGLSDAQLKSGLPSGFDPSIWKQNAKLNNGYPYLIANPPQK
ncbi:MAG: GLUG motif-containing protein [Rhizomicrobium sp.]